MTRYVSMAALALLATTTLAQTPEQIAQYPEFAVVLEELGFSWEPYEVKTEDGWYLTVFRVTGRTDQAQAPQDPSTMPILCQHGADMSASSWAGGGIFDASLPLQLVDRGYDVWLGNTRGVLYSDRHERDGEWTLREKWNFNWADMGMYDIPAVVDKIIEVTGKPKVTMMGYSQGTSQMWYGLAKKQDFFAERVNRYIAMASCLIANPTMSYEQSVLYHEQLDQLGIYNTNGLDESSAFESEINCILFGSNCDAELDPEPEQAQAINSYRYFHQLAIERRFQEPQTLEAYARGERITPLVDLAQIDRVPVSIVHPIDDALCPVSQAEWQLVQLTTPEKYLRFEHGGHGIFGYKSDRAFVDRMVETIETGTAQAAIIAQYYTLFAGVCFTLSSLI